MSSTGRCGSDVARTVNAAGWLEPPRAVRIAVSAASRPHLPVEDLDALVVLR